MFNYVWKSLVDWYFFSAEWLKLYPISLAGSITEKVFFKSWNWLNGSGKIHRQKKMKEAQVSKKGKVVVHFLSIKGFDIDIHCVGTDRQKFDLKISAKLTRKTALIHVNSYSVQLIQHSLSYCRVSVRSPEDYISICTRGNNSLGRYNQTFKLFSTKYKR